MNRLDSLKLEKAEKRITELEAEKQNLNNCLDECRQENERLKKYNTALRDYLRDIVLAGPDDAGTLIDLARMALNPSDT